MWGIFKKIKMGFGFNIIIYLILLIVFALAVFGIAFFKNYLSQESFFEGVTIEAFGMLFDILVLGIIFNLFYNIRERNRDIQRYLEEIEDFRHWDEKEAMYRTVGNIKRLIKLGAKNLPLDYSYLEDAILSDLNLDGASLRWANLKKADLSGAKLNKANFEGTDLNGSNLQDAKLHSSIFQDAILNEANLQKAELNNAKFQEAVLIGASLWNACLIGADLTDTKLEDADLNEADLTDIRGIKESSLLNVKTLYDVKGLTPSIEEYLRRRKPELFENLEELDEDEGEEEVDDEEQEDES